MIWKERVQGLHEFGNWADAEAIKAWLRSRHARRERLRGDSEEIENQFHRWVRENERHLGLTSGGAFADFIRRDFEFYCRWYRDILDASWCLEFAAKLGLEVIYRNQQANFRHRNALMLAALRPSDEEETVRQKLRAVGAYIEILVARYAWLGWAYNREAMYNRTLELMAELREVDGVGLADVLERPLRRYGAHFPVDVATRYDWQNGKRFHRLLARMMDYVDGESSVASDAGGAEGSEWRSRYS